MDNKIRRKMSRHPNILFRRRTFWIRKIIRYALRKFDSSKPSQPQPFQPNWKPFQMHAHQLQLDGFVFIENFLNDSDAELIRKNWPKSRYFSPISPNEDHKTSDKGLVCELGKPLFNTSRSPYLWGLFQMFMNKSFTDEVSALCGDGINRYPYHMLAQNSYWGSGLAPQTTRLKAPSHWRAGEFGPGDCCKSIARRGGQKVSWLGVVCNEVRTAWVRARPIAAALCQALMVA